ncbi:helix-hairpin-helix domain-containing protein [Shewanella sp. SW36]|uniref:helix-hairpin-helix domain-containing protein n=1 Tax=unclassified Shewanella TaxID=196818 RepID=UPI0021DAEEDA|nr:MULTISPECIES: helix-hairpin-helix domain-containing protein [unclassified Shewanella]MCU7974569.1 helix-hairpin-helix domain-containing protein [Shewanella sp. SW36]MCU7989957.1 helix-hairpin-helix domain-containing protein [Shewanella sp. SW1]MCU8051354.1 helix-hairpin-helix domain-containing protein [Shewanella sp. SM43]
MNPAKVMRAEVKQLTDLPNIGKACAADLRLLGIDKPEQLLDRNPYELYQTLCDKTGQRHDPCMLDVFISITRFMAGEDAKPWWFYTDERKNTLEK